MKNKNTVALYVDKSMVNVYKASLDMYEALELAEKDLIYSSETRGIIISALTKAREGSC